MIECGITCKGNGDYYQLSKALVSIIQMENKVELYDLSCETVYSIGLDDNLTIWSFKVKSADDWKIILSYFPKRGRKFLHHHIHLGYNN